MIVVNGCEYYYNSLLDKIIVNTGDPIVDSLHTRQLLSPGDTLRSVACVYSDVKLPLTKYSLVEGCVHDLIVLLPFELEYEDAITKFHINRVNKTINTHHVLVGGEVQLVKTNFSDIDIFKN